MKSTTETACSLHFKSSKVSTILADRMEQGWPTSQMLRATFLSVFWRRAISYTRDNDRITIPLKYFCLARLVVYRPVSSVGNDIAIGASCLGFVA